MYDKLFLFFALFFKKATLFRVMFNISPMYRRSCGSIIFVSDDIHVVKIKIPLSYRNRNYVGSMFGGSLFAATDPIYMIQLMQILGNEYVVWDKATEIKFKRPAYTKAFATFEFKPEEIEEIRNKVNTENEVDYIKKLIIKDKNNTVFTELHKTIYITCLLSDWENFIYKQVKLAKQIIIYTRQTDAKRPLLSMIKCLLLVRVCYHTRPFY
jgi:acyl-CoA hydrolase